MRTSKVRNSVREKLHDLRCAAKQLRPSVSGSQREHSSATLKNFKNWSDLRDKAKLGTR